MLERLKQLEKNLEELKRFKKKTSLKEVHQDIQKQWILRYGLFESIQIVIDVSCHLAVRHNLGNPTSYLECVELLLKYGYLRKEIFEKLKGMIGLRNILIHEYPIIDIEQLYNFLDHLSDFSDFAQEVRKYL